MSVCVCVCIILAIVSYCCYFDCLINSEVDFYFLFWSILVCQVLKPCLCLQYVSSLLTSVVGILQEKVHTDAKI